MSWLANIRDGHWELVARCCKKFCTKGALLESVTSTLISALVAAMMNAKCALHGEMDGWKRGVARVGEEGDTWRFLGCSELAGRKRN